MSVFSHSLHPGTPLMMTYEMCTQTDAGRVRKNNEDAVAVDPNVGLCLLADGMGGYNAGEVASSMAVAFINFELGRWLARERDTSTREVSEAMELCMENANHSIFTAARSNHDYEGMGTTVVVGVFQEDRLLLGHVGDSRCYRLRGQAFHQITKDHSLLQEQIDAGLITPEQALASPDKNLITRALGVEDAVRAEIKEHRTEIGDMYLMCSDGLSDMLGDAEIAAILGAVGPRLPDTALRLVEAANLRGGRDNISVVLIRVTRDAARRGLLDRMRGR